MISSNYFSINEKRNPISRDSVNNCYRDIVTIKNLYLNVFDNRKGDNFREMINVIYYFFFLVIYFIIVCGYYITVILTLYYRNTNIEFFFDIFPRSEFSQQS